MNARPTLLAFAGYTVLAVAITFPLILQLPTAVPHDLGDPLLSAGLLWWNAHTVPLTEQWWNGFGFVPAPGMLTFSDHRLGVSLIASPIQWLGGSDITAYNLALLLTFPLSAIAAHALGVTLTGRHDAAAVCGLAYGFNPYRIAHIEHLELLAAYGMPLALVALHRYRDTRDRKWIGLLAIALVLQGLSTSYFLLFFCVLLALWLLWFVHWRDWRFVAAVLIGGLGAAVALSPIIAGYLRIHRNYGMVRSMAEVLEYSADLASLGAASPLLWFWGWTSTIATSERQLFPGLAVTVIAAAGAAFALRQRSRHPAGGSTSPSIVFAILGLLAIAAATSVRIVGPWRVGPLQVSTDLFKPQSTALLFLALSVATLPATRAAFARRSALAFYLFAFAALFLCSLGPKPTWLGEQALYEPPYAWLMHLPVFGTDIRAPARFAMPAVLTLAAAGAISWARLTSRHSVVGRAAWIAACLAIVADTWTGGLPMARMRSSWSPAWAAGASSVLELPLGRLETDVAAMYRATKHRRPVVNGYSGFSPPHYSVLRRALEEQDTSILPQVTAAGPVLVAIDRRADRDRHLEQLVTQVDGAAELGFEGRWMFVRLPATPRTNTTVAVDPLGDGVCRGTRTIAAISGPSGNTAMDVLLDGDPESGWVSSQRQQAGDAITLTLGGEVRTCSVSLMLGPDPAVYPGSIAVDASIDGSHWETVFEGRTGGLTMAGALRDPQRSPLTLAWENRPARHLRLRLLESHDRYPWAMREIAVAAER